MKTTKRLLALLTALAMTASFACITASADEAAPASIFTDDFESYVIDADSEANLATTGSKYTTHVKNDEGTVEDSTNWYTGGYSNGPDGAAKTGVIADPTTADNKVLAVEARSTYNAWASKPRVFNQVAKANNTDKYTYKFDFYRSTYQAGGGILFAYAGENDKPINNYDYYAVDFVGEGDHAHGWMVKDSELYSTVVAKKGAVQYDATITTTPDKVATKNRYKTGEKDDAGKDIEVVFDTYVNDKLADSKWFTAEVSVYAGNIEWTVTQKGVDADSDGNDDIVQTGSWTDPNPIAKQPTMFALYGGGQYDTFMYFDNVSVTKTAMPFVEEGVVVPDNAILYDNFNSYDEVYNTADYTIGKDVAVAGNWYNRTVDGFGFGGWNQHMVGTAVILNPTDFGKALTINAQTGWAPTSAANTRPAAPSVEYSGVTMNQDDIYTYTFDIYRNANTYDNAGGGIRFNYKGKDFYELYFMGDEGAKDGTLKTQLSKVEGASWTVLQPKITSTLANNKLLKQKWYTVSVTVEKGDIAWTVVEKATGTTVQTGSYKDNKPFRGENFTMRLFAAGQGGEYVTFDNVLVTETKSSKPSLGILYTYEESFGGYDSEDGAVAVYADNVSIIDSPLVVRARKNDLTVLKNDAGSWELSKVHSYQGFPGAYINGNNSNLHLLGHQGQNSVTKGICDRYYPAVVNFKPATTGSVVLEELVIKGEKNGASRFGIRVAISEDEQSYYEFGRGDWYDTMEETGLPVYAPYFVKCIDGVRTMVEYSDESDMMNDQSPKTWTVTVDGENVTVNVKTSYKTDYTFTFTDDDGLFAKMAYPFAVYSAAGAVFDNVTVKYVPDADVFVDNGNGTATITAVPARYLENGTALKLVTAFYNANDAFISASENTLSAKGSYTINTPASYDYAKVMMYDGNNLVKEISTKEEVVEVAKDKTVIACVGDSNTGNNGNTTNDSWSTRIGAMLGEDYDVQNYGRAGYRLMNGFAVEAGGNPSYTLSEEYAASLLSNPDIVIIMLGTNDGSIGAAGSEKYEQFRADYISLIETYKNLPTHPEIILTVPPIRGTAANPNHNADSIRPVIQELSQMYGYRYVDMTALVTDYSLLYDTLHFTDDGYFQFAEHFYNAVKHNVETRVSEDKMSVIINSDASFDSDIAVAVYKNDALAGVELVKNAKVLSAVDYYIDVPALNIDAGDKVKVMILDENLAPYTYAQTITNKDAYVSNDKALVAGNTDANAKVGVTVYNGTNLVYADTTIADGSGYYEFAPALSAGTYSVIANGKTATLTVE